MPPLPPKITYDLIHKDGEILGRGLRFFDAKNRLRECYIRRGNYTVTYIDVIARDNGWTHTFRGDTWLLYAIVHTKPMPLPRPNGAV